MLHESVRQQVVDACRRLSRENLVVGTAGNVSVRVGDHVVISPSGVDYERMRARDVGVHGLDGHAVEAELEPSSELPLHLSLYRSFDHTAVVHTHSVSSTALSVVVDEVPASHYYTALFGVPCGWRPTPASGPRRSPRTSPLHCATGPRPCWPTTARCWSGRTWPRVLARVAYLEYLCEVQLKIAGTGLPAHLLDEAEIERVRIALSGYGQTPRR